MGTVYLLMNTDYNGDTELFKIGVTTGLVEKRIKSLSTGNPNKIKLIKTYESKNYLKIEKWLHARYKLNKTEANNEWFCLPNDDVAKFITICETIDVNIKLLSSNNNLF